MANQYYVGESVSQIAVALSQDIPALYAAIAAIPVVTPANPSASIGLAAVNGTALTYMRSDAAPALSQAIQPTWTGTHTFSPASGATTFNGKPNTDTVLVQGSSTSGQSYGLDVLAGTTSADACARFNNASNTQSFLRIAGDGKSAFGFALGINGATPPAQVAGWGTPTGAAVQNNFAGASATLATLGAAVAKIITDLKAFGLYAA